VQLVCGGDGENKGWNKREFLRSHVLPNAPLAVQASKRLAENVFRLLDNTGDGEEAEVETLTQYTSDQLARVRMSPEVPIGAMSVLTKQKAPWAKM
jgi:hypothetical protein